jgi:hypothetical protein
MELKWRSTFSKSELFNDKDNLIASFNLNDTKSFQLSDYSITSNGFYSYYIKDSIGNIIQATIDPIKLTISLGSLSYEFIYENNSHSYIKTGLDVIASYYKDKGLFSSSGTITLVDNLKHSIILGYFIIVLRQLAKEKGSE